MELDAKTTIHAAFSADGIEAGVHFRSYRSSPSAGDSIDRPDPAVVLGEIFSDGEGIPDDEIVMVEARDFPIGGKVTESFPA